MSHLSTLRNHLSTHADTWAITAGHALNHWYPAVIVMVLPYIAITFGLSYAQVGVLMAVRHVSSAITTILAGMMTDNFGNRVHWILGVTWGSTLCYAFLLFSGAYVALVILMAAMGISMQVWHAAAIPWLSERYPRRLGLMLSIHSIAGHAGGALAPVSVGVLLTWMTWQMAALSGAVPGVLFLVLVTILTGRMIFLKEPAALNEDGDGSQPVTAAKGAMTPQLYLQGFRAMFKGTPMAILMLVQALRTSISNTLSTFLPQFLVHTVALAPALVGIYITFLTLVGLVPGPYISHLSDRYSRKRISLWASGLALLAIVIALPFGGLIFAGVVSVSGYFLIAISPIMQAWAMQVAPKEVRGTAIGMLFLAQSGASIILPIIAGVLADRYGLYSMFYLSSVFLIAATVVIVYLPPDSHEKSGRAA